jgi:hypothetical protein
MAHEQLADYIKKAVEHGHSKEQIRTELITAGWNATDVDAALSGGLVVPVPSAPIASGATNPLPSAVEMWKRAWAVFRARTSLFVTVSLVYAVVTLGANLIMPSPESLKDSASWVRLIVLFILLPLVQLLATLALMFAAQSEKGISFAEAYRLALKKFPRAIWLSVVSFIIVTGSSMFFAIPGLVFAGWFIFAMYVLVFEDQGGMNALFYSREYVRGRWWTAVGFTLLPIIIALVIVLAVNLIIGAFKIPYLADILNSAIGIVIGSVTAIYMYMVYAGFKAQKGPVVVKITVGRKAKYLAIGLAGIILPLLIFGGSILALITITKKEPKLWENTRNAMPRLELNTNIPTETLPQ